MTLMQKKHGNNNGNVEVVQLEPALPHNPKQTKTLHQTCKWTVDNQEKPHPDSCIEYHNIY